MPLGDIQKKFILHWGEMGARWGINRTVAQIHALLYLSPKPLDAEQIADTLGVARSNVSNSLKELQGWGVVKVVHTLGERRDQFECMKDVWEMFRLIMDERKRRECDPTLQMLRECVAESENSSDEHTATRLGEMLQVFELSSNWYDQTRKLPTAAVVRMCKMCDKVAKLLGLGS